MLPNSADHQRGRRYRLRRRRKGACTSGAAGCGRIRSYRSTLPANPSAAPAAPAAPAAARIHRTTTPMPNISKVAATVFLARQRAPAAREAAAMIAGACCSTRAVSRVALANTGMRPVRSRRPALSSASATAESSQALSQYQAGQGIGSRMAFAPRTFLLCVRKPCSSSTLTRA